MNNAAKAFAGIVTAVLATSVLGVAPAHADPWSDAVLAEHSRARAQYGAGPLSWSPTLYPGTLAWAQQCRFAHSDPGGSYGENLYASTNPETSIRDAMAAWMAEAQQYDYGTPGFSHTTGHFTQIVWKATSSVAAATVTCPAGAIFSRPTVFVVVRYFPPGNVEGLFPQNVGRPG